MKFRSRSFGDKYQQAGCVVLRTSVGCILEGLWPGKEGSAMVLDLQRYWARNEVTDLIQNNKIVT